MKTLPRHSYKMRPRFVRGPLMALAVLCTLMMGAQSVTAQTDAKKKLKLAPKSETAPAAGKKKKRTDEDRAKDAILGYYNALIERKHDVAGTFVHPDMVDAIRKPLIADIEKAAAGNQKATLRALGVRSLSELKSLSDSKFFSHFVRSRYGGTIAFIGDVSLKTTVDVVELKCEKGVKMCRGLVKLTATNREGKRVDDFTAIAVERVDARWLVGKRPPAPAAANGKK